jgi:Zn-dependent protease with chaperone function
VIAFKGRWYDGKSSAQTGVICEVYDNGSVHVKRLADGETIYRQPAFDATVTPRLADTPRYLRFKSGGKLETVAHDALDRVIDRHGKPSWLGAVHRMETRLIYVLAALAVLAAILWAVMSYGIPAASKFVAFRLPPSVLDVAARQTLDILEKSFLNDTALDASTIARLEERFSPALVDHPQIALKILFRKGDRSGPNAFALPDGTIIFTDEMVEIAEDDNELLAVLAHEIGHVVHRHGLRMIVQNSLLVFILLAITGDATGSSELFLGFPIFLTERAYARGFEREADRYALTYLQKKGLPTVHFANLMRRIADAEKPDADAGDRRWMSYLSTHPLTAERIKAFEAD